MNMKKTLAVIAAATLAVSAMATTISATNGGSYTYNLVESTNDVKTGSGSITGYVGAADNMAGTKFELTGVGAAAITVKSVTLDGLVGDVAYTATFAATGSDTEIADASVVNIIDTGWSPAVGGAFKGTVTLNYEHDITTDTAFKAITATFTTDAITTAAAPTNVKNVLGDLDGATGDDILTPFKTGFNDDNDDFAATNIVSYLEGTQGYSNVKAVLNDAIANFNDVKLVFATATQPVLDDVYSDDDNAEDKYLQFNQGTYNLFGDEASNYNGIGDAFNWGAANLHQAALIVNNNYTMAYSEILPYEFLGDTLTFDLSGILAQDNYNTLAYMGYIQNLQLATTTTWYWDSMTLTFANVEDSDVGAGEGLEDSDDVLPDVDVTPDEVIPEPEVETPVETAPSATGNAPIALAVIPVALAAAAIVAKKRK